MRVRSTNAVPIIVERAMWWPQPNWYEAHNAPGTTVTGTRWALAGGEVGGASGLQTSCWSPTRRRPPARRG